VGEVGLPALVGHRGLEPDVGGLGSLLRLGDHQTGLGQVAGDGGPGDRVVVVVGQMPADGVRAGVHAGRGQLLPELDDQVDGLGGDRGRGGLGSPGAGLEDGVALAAVAGKQLIEPGLGDAVLGGDVTDRSVLDHHSGDHQTVDSHRRSVELGKASVRDDARHQSGMT